MKSLLLGYKERRKHNGTVGFCQPAKEREKVEAQFWVLSLRSQLFQSCFIWLKVELECKRISQTTRSSSTMRLGTIPGRARNLVGGFLTIHSCLEGTWHPRGWRGWAQKQPGAHLHTEAKEARLPLSPGSVSCFACCPGALWKPWIVQTVRENFPQLLIAHYFYWKAATCIPHFPFQTTKGQVQRFQTPGVNNLRWRGTVMPSIVS